VKKAKLTIDDCPHKRFVPGMVCRNACEDIGTCAVGRSVKRRKPAAIFHSHGYYGARRPK